MRAKQVIDVVAGSAVSRVVRAGDFVFCTARAPFDDRGELVAGGIEAQTRRVLDLLAADLQKANCSLDDVVKATVFLSDVRDFPGFGKVYREYFTKDPPVRTTVGVTLVMDAKVEIEVLAFCPV